MHELLGEVHASHEVIFVTNEGCTFVCGDLHGCYDQLMH